MFAQQAFSTTSGKALLRAPGSVFKLPVRHTNFGCSKAVGAVKADLSAPALGEFRQLCYSLRRMLSHPGISSCLVCLRENSNCNCYRQVRHLVDLVALGA
jgi:hypothetical protein